MSLAPGVEFRSLGLPACSMHPFIRKEENEASLRVSLPCSVATMLWVTSHLDVLAITLCGPLSLVVMETLVHGDLLSGQSRQRQVVQVSLQNSLSV